MRVAVHQPNFFPGLGFFRKAQAADTLILLDTADFSRDSYTQRTKINTGMGVWRWLTAPIAHSFYRKPICEVETPVGSWINKHLWILEENYRRYPYWGKYAMRLSETYSFASHFQSFSRWNGLGISWLMEELGLDPSTQWASELIEKQGEPSQTLCDLVQKVGGDTYLSGSSGKIYLDETPFKKAGINVEYHKTDPYPYSALDYLFRGGKPL